MKLRSILFICLVLLGTSCSLIKHSPGKGYKLAKETAFDAVIIPGFPHDGKNWNDVIKFRLMWALHLHENKLADYFIFSGGAVHSPYNEGIIMALYAIKMGIPKEKIIIEPNAEHSSENVYYSLKICEEKGFKKIAIATDPVQGFLLTNYTERIRNTRISYINIIPRKIRYMKHCDEPKINATLAFDENYNALKKRKSYWERKKASLGLNIDYGMKIDDYLKYSKWFKW